MKIIFSCIHFSSMAISPQNNERKKVFYTGKLYASGLTGMDLIHTCASLVLNLELEAEKVFQQSSL